MDKQLKRNRFIPYRKADIIDMCLADSSFTAQEKDSFRQFCHILESLFHFEFHRKLEALKTYYAPFNPDSDTRSVRVYSEYEKQESQIKLAESLKELFNAANFQRLSESDLLEALQEESLFKIRLYVNFDDFEEALFYCRGESRKQETVVQWFGLKKETIEFTHYSRVVVFLKFKDQSALKADTAKNPYFIPGSTTIKLFQNVPKADLEMLFPNCEVRMKPIDKALIGAPAVVGGTMLIVTKLGASLVLVISIILYWFGYSEQAVTIEQEHLIALTFGMLTLGGFIFKQIDNFKNRKIRFMKALADSLYFKNLDNNVGVFHHIVDTAEEEEFKEALLAYYFLLTAGQDLTEERLDQAIEHWFETKHNCTLDFEIDDALHKLERLELVYRDGQRLRAIGLDKAKRQLDKMWDNYFTYHRSD